MLSEALTYVWILGFSQILVAVETVKGFQRQLQRALRKCAESGLPEWNLLYSSAWKRLPLTNFDAFFRS